MFIYYLHFSEDKYDCSKLENLREQTTKISAIGKVPPEIPSVVLHNILARHLCKTGNLVSNVDCNDIRVLCQ